MRWGWAAAIAVLVSACTTPPPPQPVAAASAAAPTSPAPATAADGSSQPADAGSAPETPPPDQVWDVTRIRCEQWLGASDQDRSAASMFYYGYVAARSRARAVNVSQIEANTRRAVEVCGRTPSAPVLQVFERVLAHGF